MFICTGWPTWPGSRFCGHQIVIFRLPMGQHGSYSSSLPASRTWQKHSAKPFPWSYWPPCSKTPFHQELVYQKVSLYQPWRLYRESRCVGRSEHLRDIITIPIAFASAPFACTTATLKQTWPANKSHKRAWWHVGECKKCKWRAGEVLLRVKPTVFTCTFLPS